MLLGRDILVCFCRVMPSPCTRMSFCPASLILASTLLTMSWATSLILWWRMQVLSCNVFRSASALVTREVMSSSQKPPHNLGALESGMCDVIKIRLKRGDARINIKWKLHLKFGNPSFKIVRSTAVVIFSGWFPFPLLVAILL